MNTRGSTGDAHPPARWSPAERAMWRAYRQGEWCTPAAGSTDPALRADRIWGAVQDLAVGYGYRPGRAAAIFGALLLGGTAYFAAVPDCAGAGGLCPVNAGDQRTWDPFLYVLDVLVPIVDIGHEKAWNPNGPDKVVMIALLVSGWVYATALVAAAGRALSRS
ncbi:hypothetical protein [Phytohabitans houttuyneae]|nr:hypothetical protein [Phytohabitans houttuyneae]